MNAKLSILFYAKRGKSKVVGLLPIFIRITLDGSRIEFSTKPYSERASNKSLYIWEDEFLKEINHITSIYFIQKTRLKLTFHNFLYSTHSVVKIQFYEVN